MAASKPTAAEIQALIDDPAENFEAFEAKYGEGSVARYVDMDAEGGPASKAPRDKRSTTNVRHDKATGEISDIFVPGKVNRGMGKRDSTKLEQDLRELNTPEIGGPNSNVPRSRKIMTDKSTMDLNRGLRELAPKADFDSLDNDVQTKIIRNYMSQRGLPNRAKDKARVYGALRELGTEQLMQLLRKEDMTMPDTSDYVDETMQDEEVQ